jgi:hypothetical protein
MLANFGNPVKILAASCCISSILFKSKELNNESADLINHTFAVYLLVMICYKTPGKM